VDGVELTEALGVGVGDPPPPPPVQLPNRITCEQVELGLGLALGCADADGVLPPPGFVLPPVFVAAGVGLADGLFMIFIVEVFGAVKAGSPENLELVPCISFMNSAQIGIETEAPKEKPAPLMLSTGAWTIAPFSLIHLDTATSASSFGVYPLNETAAVV